MAEKKKPQDDLVALAGRAMRNPEALSGADIKRMAARILDDQRNDPEPNKGKTSLASKVVAKVSELLPSAVTGDDKTATAKPKSALAAKPAPEAATRPASKPKPAGKAAAEPSPKPAKAPAGSPKTAARARATPKG